MNREQLDADCRPDSLLCSTPLRALHGPREERRYLRGAQTGAFEAVFDAP